MSGRSDWDDVDLSQYWDNDYEEETPALLHLWDGLVVRRGFSDAIEGGSSSLDLGDDVVDGLGPHERLRVVVPV